MHALALFFVICQAEPDHSWTTEGGWRYLWVGDTCVAGHPVGKKHPYDFQYWNGSQWIPYGKLSRKLSKDRDWSFYVIRQHTNALVLGPEQWKIVAVERNQEIVGVLFHIRAGSRWIQP